MPEAKTWGHVMRAHTLLPHDAIQRAAAGAAKSRLPLIQLTRIITRQQAQAKADLTRKACPAAAATARRAMSAVDTAPGGTGCLNLGPGRGKTGKLHRASVDGPSTKYICPFGVDSARRRDFFSGEGRRAAAGRPSLVVLGAADTGCRLHTAV